MPVSRFCRMAEQEVFSVPTVVQGPSFVSTEMLFYSQEGSGRGEIDIYIVKNESFCTVFMHLSNSRIVLKENNSHFS